MKPRRIAIFGLFGQGNIGNECTLEALLHNIYKSIPDTELFLVCTDPQDASRRHNLPAIPYCAHHAPKASSRRLPEKRNTFTRLLRILLLRIPIELGGWFSAFRALRGSDMLAMTGTGMLTDYNTRPFGRPYEIFKWALVARLRRCKVRFISVGVGPLHARLTRFFTRAALRLADYRSYRDDISKGRIERAGLRLSPIRDFVFPDLVFSLPRTLFPESQECRRSPPVVAVGVMDYYGQGPRQDNRERVYHRYLEKMCEFIIWLLNHGYSVRVVHGDMVYDRDPRRDLKAYLEHQGFRYKDHDIVDDDILSVDDLLAQLAPTSLVVSPRYHNQLLALMMCKPVISISYDSKSHALMEGVGLERYCQPIDHLNVDGLIHQFIELESTFDKIKASVSQRMEEYRNLLDEQYRLVFGAL